MEKVLVELEGKKIYIGKAPATVAYDVALKYRGAMEKNEYSILQECLYELLRYCELDLGDGRMLKLDSKDIINQHFTNVNSLIELQKKVVEANFGFLG